MAKEQINSPELQYNKQIDVLNKQIDIITIRQQELQALILDINGSIQFFQHSIQNAAAQGLTPDKVKALRLALVSNITTINDLYGTYKEFENTKAKYFSDISNLIHKKSHLVHVDIPKVNKSGPDDGEFASLLSSFVKIAKGDSESINNPIFTDATNELNEDDSYKL